MSTKPDTKPIAEKFALALDTYSSKKGGLDSIDEAIPFFEDAITEAVRAYGLDMVHCDVNHPFYIETMDQAAKLKAVAHRLCGTDAGNVLDTAARKLEYFAQCFTCTANLAAVELALKECRQQLEIERNANVVRFT